MESKLPDPPSSRSSLLRTQASRFCNAFLSATPPNIILDTYFTKDARIHEHGPAWANERLPFLGRTFRDRRMTIEKQTGKETTVESTPTCDDYFDRLAQTLDFQPNENTFPPESHFVVDTEAGDGGVVNVVGKGGFTSVKRGEGWEEQFMYRISHFDDQGRIGCWEIWADPLSAWVAVGLEEER
ncbi:hypothetical protein MMC20_002217 [Loxospora ochrophaea]|nr:hypothetical protein [Loxospora ochrophaea]